MHTYILTILLYIHVYSSNTHILTMLLYIHVYFSNTHILTTVSELLLFSAKEATFLL